MKNKTFLVVASAAFILQAGILAWMIIQREIILTQGELYRFKAAPVDPYDAFRGRYVRVDIEGGGPFRTDTQLQRGMPLYPSLVVDANGIATLTNPAVRPPVDTPYIKVKCRYSSPVMRDSGIVTTNFDKYANNVVATNTSPKMVMSGKYTTHVELPFDRYYLDEKLAPKAEQVYNETRSGDQRNRKAATLLVRVRKGRALIEMLEIDGIPIRDLALEEQARTP
ncbi:MAG: GDYXXLXY domain-containing protein [Kiritimatiellae bacterium]|nr:GDYXXLXY domain-containing protein [Kiritimatiellia bacterium]